MHTKGKVPNYADFSDGQLHQAVEIKEKKKDQSTLRKPENQCQGLSAKFQPYSTTKIQQLKNCVVSMCAI